MKTRNFSVSIFASVVLSLFAVGAADALDWPQWRGPNRDGISRETGLLQEWPAGGPKLAWRLTDIGSGYSTPAVVGGHLYLLGNQGLENEYVLALDASDGKRLWSTRLGNVGNPKQQPSFPAARSTPTVLGDVLYALSSDGDLACLELASGKIKWQKNLRADFAGKPGTWAYAESPLIDGETLVCTPGGNDATIVALNRNSGQLLWKCAVAEGDEAAYASAVVMETRGTRQYVQLLQKGLAGVDAKSGKLLWRYRKPTSAFNANIPSPLASDSCVYAGSAGTGGGAVKVSRNGDGFAAEQLYFSPKLPTAIGGVIKIGNFLYGTSGQGMLCVEFATGDIKWQERALGPASLCYADGRLYLHSEAGDAALVAPSPEAYREKGRFTPPGQPKHSNDMEKAWAYPVVANGRLYLRDHGSLWCYQVGK